MEKTVSYVKEQPHRAGEEFQVGSWQKQSHHALPTVHSFSTYWM